MCLANRRRWMSDHKDLPNPQVFFCVDYFACIVDIVVMHNYYLYYRPTGRTNEWRES